MVEEPEEELTILQRLIKLIFASTIKETLEEAEETYDGVCAKRKTQIEDILLHEKCSISPWNYLWGLVGPLLGMIFVFIGFVLWPTVNVFKHPSHWYECMLQCGIVWVGELRTNVASSFLFKQLV